MRRFLFLLLASAPVVGFAFDLHLEDGKTLRNCKILNHSAQGAKVQHSAGVRWMAWSEATNRPPEWAEAIEMHDAAARERQQQAAAYVLSKAEPLSEEQKMRDAYNRIAAKVQWEGSNLVARPMYETVRGKITSFVANGALIKTDDGIVYVKTPEAEGWKSDDEVDLQYCRRLGIYRYVSVLGSERRVDAYVSEPPGKIDWLSWKEFVQLWQSGNGKPFEFVAPDIAALIAKQKAPGR